MDLIQASYRYLKDCRINVSKSYLSFRIKSHPDFPSLVSLTDTLDELNIVYKAVQADKTRIEELSLPFLAQTGKQAGAFEIINSARHAKTDSEFIKRWNGVAIMIEPKQVPGNKQYDAYLNYKKRQSNILAYYAASIFIVIAGISFIHFNFFKFTLLSMSLAGCTFCLLIILRKFGVENKIIQKFCVEKNTNSCDRVINSKGAKILKDVDLSDLGLIYFSSLSIFLLFTIAGGIGDSFLSFLLIPFTLAFAITIFSIYYQLKLRSWCKLCLSITGVIWIQFAGIIWQFNFFKYPVINTSYSTIMYELLAITLSGSWLVFKPFLIIKKLKERTDIQLEKWKRNPDVFRLLLKEAKQLKSGVLNNPLFIGKDTAPLHITLVSNPFCKPCATTHQKLDDLFEKYPNDISFSVIFIVRDAKDEADKKNVAIKHILNRIDQNNQVHILRDWFEIMDTEKWEKAYPEHTMTKEADDTMLLYEEWTKLNKPVATPLVFLNECSLPKEYDLADIDSFMFDISSGMLVPPKNKNERFQEM